MACILFIVEAIVYIPTENWFLTFIRYLLLSLDTLFDNFIVVYMCLSHRKSPWRAVLISSLISVVYLIYALAINSSSENCPWCGIHFPNSEIMYPYLAASLIYIAIFVYTVSGMRCWGIEPRPNVAWWCFHLAVYYITVGLGLFLLTHIGADAGYCIVDVALLEYSLVYALLLYYIMIRDSRYVENMETNQLLRAYNLPLIDLNRTWLGFRKRRKGSGRRAMQSRNRTAEDRLLAEARGRAYSTFHEDDEEEREGEEREEFDEKSMIVSEQVQEILKDSSITLISSSELTKESRLGVGGYGTVYRARWRGVRVAMKEMLGLTLLLTGRAYGVYDDRDEGEARSGEAKDEGIARPGRERRDRRRRREIEMREGGGGGRGRPPLPGTLDEEKGNGDEDREARQRAYDRSERAVAEQRQKKLEKQRVAALQEFLYETRVLSQLRHPNILSFIGVCIEPGHECIITEYMSHGNIYDLLRSNRALDWGDKLRILLHTV